MVVVCSSMRGHPVETQHTAKDGLVSAANTWFPFSLTFTATSDDLYLLFVEQGAGNSPDFYIDGLEVRLAEETDVTETAYKCLAL